VRGWKIDKRLLLLDEVLTWAKMLVLGGKSASLGGQSASIGGQSASLGGQSASLGGQSASLGGQKALFKKHSFWLRILNPNTNILRNLKSIQLQQKPLSVCKILYLMG